MEPFRPCSPRPVTFFPVFTIATFTLCTPMLSVLLTPHLLPFTPHRIFNVAKPTNTRIKLMIQKRTITRGSGQPFNSK